MEKTVLIALASLLLAGSTIGAATAKERHHVRPHYRTTPVASEPYRDPYAYRYRDSYAWSPPYPDYSYWASRLEGGVISAPAGQ
jgi:hypothetical protein